MIRLLTPALILGFSLAGGVAVAAEGEHKHDEHGPTQALGEVTAGDARLAVAVAGTITPGGQAHVEITSQPTTAAFTTIRVWIGLENGRGSEKARAGAEAGHAGHWSAHVAVPKPLPEGSRLWVQAQAAQGEPVLNSVALPQAGAQPQAAPAHDHGKPGAGNHGDHKH